MVRMTCGRVGAAVKLLQKHAVSQQPIGLSAIII